MGRKTWKPGHLPCTHGYDPATCNVCKVERVQKGVTAGRFNCAGDKYVLAESPAPISAYYTQADLRRGIAIVALRRIVDRAVSDELYSPATADILRIALKALNELED